MRRSKVRWSRCVAIASIGVLVGLAWQLQAERAARRAAEAERDAARAALPWGVPGPVLLGSVPGQRWVIQEYELSSGRPASVTLVAVPEADLLGEPLCWRD